MDKASDIKQLLARESGFFHFCGALGRSYKLGPDKITLVLCTICHSRAMAMLETRQIFSMLERFDKQARKIWEVTQKLAEVESRSHLSLFVEAMRTKGYFTR